MDGDNDDGDEDNSERPSLGPSTFLVIYTIFVFVESSKIFTQSTIQHSQFVSIQPLPTTRRTNSIIFVHFLFHLVIPWLPERQYSREMDFIFKEEIFHLSIHYVHLNNNMCIIIRKSNSSKNNPFYQLFVVFFNTFLCFIT